MGTERGSTEREHPNVRARRQRVRFHHWDCPSFSAPSTNSPSPPHRNLSRRRRRMLETPFLCLSVSLSLSAPLLSGYTSCLVCPDIRGHTLLMEGGLHSVTECVRSGSTWELNCSFFCRVLPPHCLATRGCEGLALRVSPSRGSLPASSKCLNELLAELIGQRGMSAACRRPPYPPRRRRAGPLVVAGLLAFKLSTSSLLVVATVLPRSRWAAAPARAGRLHDNAGPPAQGSHPAAAAAVAVGLRCGATSGGGGSSDLEDGDGGLEVRGPL